MLAPQLSPAQKPGSKSNYNTNLTFVNYVGQSNLSWSVGCLPNAGGCDNITFLGGVSQAAAHGDGRSTLGKTRSTNGYICKISERGGAIAPRAWPVEAFAQLKRFLRLRLAMRPALDGAL